MLCQCGKRFPDNAPYCPYCGRKNNRMRSRPDSFRVGRGRDEQDTTPNLVFPEVEGGYLKKTAYFLLGLVFLFLLLVFGGIAIDGDPTAVFEDLKEMWEYVEVCLML